MKVFVPALAAVYASPVHSIVHGLKITRQDGQVFAFSSGDREATIGGTLYRASAGLEVSSMVHNAGLAVDNLELTIFPDESLFPRIGILEGRWNHAQFALIEFNQLAPADGVNTLKRGRLGEVRVLQDRYVAELRGLSQALQQAVGAFASMTSRAELFDAHCGLDPDDWRVTGTLTDVTSNSVIRDSNREQPEDWFGEGIIRMLTGANAGLSYKVREYTEAGTFTLALPSLQAFAAGDQYEAWPGCRKRLEDCRDKFDNVRRFQGEPHIPGVDALMKPAGANDG